MTKLTLSNVQNLQNESAAVTTLAANNAATITAVENTLSRDGTLPNHMNAELDMNSNRIINLPDAIGDQEPATYSQLVDKVTALSNGAVVDASYVTLGVNSTLLNERVITPGTNIEFNDGGAGGNLVIGISDNELNALSGTVAAANKLPYFNGATTATTTDLSAYGRTLIDDVDAATARATLGAVIGTDVQAFDSDLSAVAGLITTGLVTRTGTGTATTRSITQPAAGITVTNGDGVAGNPTLALADDLAALEGLAGTGLAAHTAANTWAERTITAPAAGITVTNGNGVAGNPTLALANDLAGVEGLIGTGYAVRTAADTWTNRSLVMPAAGISGTNLDGVAGNTTLSLSNDLAAYEGLAANGMVARTATDTAAVRTITAGTAIGVTNGDGVAGNPTIAVTDAELTAIAGLTSAADALPYFTGSGTASTTTLTSTARTLLDDTSTSAMRTTLGLAIGTDVQAFDAQLFSNIPQNSQSAAYTLVATDAEKHIYHPSADTTARTWTIPANSSVPFPIGTAITFINDTSGGTISIVITTDTLVLAGSGATGGRTLTANGIATAVKVGTTRWIISGTNLT